MRSSSRSLQAYTHVPRQMCNAAATISCSPQMLSAVLLSIGFLRLSSENSIFHRNCRTVPTATVRLCGPLTFQRRSTVSNRAAGVPKTRPSFELLKARSLERNQPAQPIRKAQLHPSYHRPGPMKLLAGPTSISPLQAFICHDLPLPAEPRPQLLRLRIEITDCDECNRR